VSLRQFKQGRIAALDYGKKMPRFQYLTPAVPDDVEWYTDLHYEYYMSLVVKAVLCVAKREPGVFIKSWGQDGAEWKRSDLPGTALKAVLSGWSAPSELTALLTVRTTGGTPALTREARVTASESAKELSFPLGVLPCGRYFADLTLLRGKESVNWATTYFDVVNLVRIDSVQTDRKSYETGQAIQVTIQLTAPATKAQRLMATLKDSLNRDLARATATLEARRKTAVCSLPVAHPLAIAATVAVELQEGKEVVDASSATVGLVRRKWDDFLFCVWTAGANFNERPRRLMFDQLVDAGVDTFTNSGRDEVSVRRTAQAGFWSIPYMTRYSYEGKELIRNPCLTSPKFLEDHLKGLADVAAVQKPFDPQGYTLGDECFLARGGNDVCFSPTCTSDLREWLRKEYPNADALNASWGTKLKSIDEATPITLDEAKKFGQIPRWVDHRRHMEFVYARMMQRAREAIRQVDPTARVGFDGPFTTDSVSGNDWWQLMQAFDLCNIYFHEPDQWEQVRSFAKPGDLLGLWYGGYTGQQNEDYARFFPWRALLNGYNSVWWYAVFHGLAVCPMDAMTPSMTQYPYFAASAEEVQEIKSGVGKALMHSTRQDDGTAVHYSQSSVHASTAYAGLGLLTQTQRQWFNLLEDAGFQYTCRSYAQLEKEGLDPSRWRVLILPYSQAISSAEAKAIDTFVRAGGMLIADVRPGIADQHGKLRQPGMLDDLFGVERMEGKIALNMKAEVKLTAAVGETPTGTVVSGIAVDPNITLRGGKALAQSGDTPLLIVNRVGKGRAVLLNFSINSYNSVRSSVTVETYRSLVRGLLSMAGVTPQVQVQVLEDGKGLRQCEVARFKDGLTEYVGFLKYRENPTEPIHEAEIRWPNAAHTYDARTGKYYGKADRVLASFQPDRGKLFTRLPYAVSAVRVKTQSASIRVGSDVVVQVALATSGGRPGRHWAHVSVIGPDNKERRHYAQNIAVVDGKGEAVIPVAMNDAPGTWKVQARDVASGVIGTAELRVK